jgi:hypothetical protein
MTGCPASLMLYGSTASASAIADAYCADAALMLMSEWVVISSSVLLW